MVSWVALCDDRPYVVRLDRFQPKITSAFHWMIQVCGLGASPCQRSCDTDQHIEMKAGECCTYNNMLLCMYLDVYRELSHTDESIVTMSAH